MSESLLNKPVWSALGDKQAEFGQSFEHARRFLPIYGPLCAPRDLTQASIYALSKLEIGESGLWVFDENDCPAPIGYSIIKKARCVQMIARKATSFDIDIDYCNLSEEDSAQMLALAMQTKPGPFSSHTHRLGNFIGIKQDGVLIAMAGERLHIGKYREISGVCTDPGFRGRGFAKALIKEVMNRIFQKAETPFLHSYDDNQAAITLYESLGFEARAIVHLTILQKL